MKRVLVVCSSRTGHTRRLAEAIALRCDADLEVIKDRVDRLGLGGYLRSYSQALLHRKPWIQPPRRAAGAYALVIVGTPVWAWNMASPVRSYLVRHGERCRRVAFFCTHRGSGAAKVLSDMAILCGQRALATLAVPQHVVTDGNLDAAIEPFASRFDPQRGAASRPDQRDAA